MQILFDILDVNVDFPATFKLYGFIFVFCAAIIIIIQVYPLIQKLYNKTPFYWFLGLMLFNIINIIITLFHYHYRSGTFKGEQGPKGESGLMGHRGEPNRCAECDDKISLSETRNFNIVQKIYVNNDVGSVRKPVKQYQYYALGDSIVVGKEDEEWKLKENNRKYYTVAGTSIKPAIDYNLIIEVPAIKDKVSTKTYIWRPVAPNGYQALGDVVTSYAYKPPMDAVGCISMKCLDTINVKDVFNSWKFFYQGKNKNDTYIFCSFWETPFNTFYCNHPNTDSIVNESLFYNIVDGDMRYFNKDENGHHPDRAFVEQLKQKFVSIISPLDLKGNIQHTGNKGIIYFDEEKKIVSLWQAIEYYFPGDMDYYISVDSVGDVRGGSRLDEDQTRILLYARAWLPPNKPLYSVKTNCIIQTSVDKEKMQLINGLKVIYEDVKILLEKYGKDVPQLVDYLAVQMKNLMRKARHIPDFTKKIEIDDFKDLTKNNLQELTEALRNIHNRVLVMTKEVPPNRRKSYFELIRVMKEYDQLKEEFDNAIYDQLCDKKRLAVIEVSFNKYWDDLKFQFLADPKYKEKLRDRDFSGFSDAKLDKIVSIFTKLNTLLKEALQKDCKL